ncbi:hypothetical protein [Neptunitalea lumnitzerae]|uniref:Uncharacterized protein n=1 Tax=Neptunitalea lumnitzerae TaxID=2965509 RepID=A0ABQ5MH55_9FLAO|nr:hypothetical protein [Neptunitalea sp. Y10]GLB48750.1 hypothetical protein Y10_11180 [Neptunitalea sp. Y10]
MKFWDIIILNLWNEGFDVINEDNIIEWESEMASHAITLKNIATNGNQLAWFQHDKTNFGRCCVKIKHNDGIVVNYQPFSNHSDDGIQLYYIKWFGEKLIIIYDEKHGTRIVAIENLKVTELYVGLIYNIQIANNNIFIEDTEVGILLITINAESNEEYRLSLPDFKRKHRTIKMRNFSYFFNDYEDDYNKD